MIESRKFVAAAILFGLALIFAGLMLTPSNGARAAGQADFDVAAARIGGAFAVISNASNDPTLAVAAKGDLKAPADCAAETWPNIDATCLSTADGRPAPHVRAVTVGYQVGQSTTVLLRIPSNEVAQR